MPPFHGERMTKLWSNYGGSYSRCYFAMADRANYLCAGLYPRNFATSYFTDYLWYRSRRYDRLKSILVDFLDIFNSPLNSFFLFFPWLQKDLGALTPWGKFLKQKRQIREMLQTECDRRRNNPATKNEDILSLLLEARYEDGQPMSDAEIQDELLTMLFAGHETTASSLAWSFYWLHRLPEVGQKLQQELNFSTKDAEFTDIAKLPYLSAVVSETLRLNPVVVFVGRQLKQPFQIKYWLN